LEVAVKKESVKTPGIEGGHYKFRKYSIASVQIRAHRKQDIKTSN